MKRLLAALTFSLVPVLAQATPITFGFTGVTDVFGPFFGSYRFDSNAGAADGHYSFSGPPYGMIIHLPSITLQWLDLEIDVINDVLAATPTFLSDLYVVQVFDAFNHPSHFVLQDCSGATFASAALPLTPPDLSSFRPNCTVGDEVVIQGAIGNQGFFTGGRLTSLFLVPSADAEKIPEPASWLLLAFGLIAVARVGCRIEGDRYSSSGKTRFLASD